MTELKLRKEGDSLAVTIPAGIASNMKVAEGDIVHLTELPGGGYRITPHDPELVAQMRVIEDIKTRYRNTLKILGE
jgi:antitoxin component of MazEF toxin-antitoxin module